MNHKFNVVIAAFAVAAAGHVSAQEVVKIGHVGPTSGAIAHLGKDNENGARMAIDELNAKGVSIGGKKVKFELLAEDDGGDPKQGTAAAQKLVDSKVNGVVGHLNSGTSIPASKIYSDAGIPQISPSATNPKYTRQGFKTTFRVVADDVHLGGTLGRYAAKDLKGKSIAVIDDRTAYGQGVADEFEKGVKGAGGKTVAREFTNDKATDFTAILTNLKAKKPDIIFFGGMDAVAGPMIRQMKQLGIKAKFMGGDGIPVFLLGTRDSPAEPFRYLRIPADDQNSLDGFLRLRAAPPRAAAFPAARAAASRLRWVRENCLSLDGLCYPSLPCGEPFTNQR